MNGAEANVFPTLTGLKVSRYFQCQNRVGRILRETWYPVLFVARVVESTPVMSSDVPSLGASVVRTARDGRSWGQSAGHLVLLAGARASSREYRQLVSELWDGFFDGPLRLTLLLSFKIVECSFQMIIFSNRGILCYLLKKKKKQPKTTVSINTEPDWCLQISHPSFH